jgi:hypothetical protein
MPYQAQRLLLQVQQNLLRLEEHFQTANDVRGNLKITDFSTAFAAEETSDRNDILLVLQTLATVSPQVAKRTPSY